MDIKIKGVTKEILKEALEQAGQKDPVQSQSQTVPIQEKFQTFAGADETKRTRKIIDESQGRACICCRQRAASIPKNTLPRSAKADGETEYAVRSGEPDSG